MWTDNPVNDFLNWDAAQVAKQERYDSMCEKCCICKEKIDWEDDMKCLNFLDRYAHIKCFSDMVYKWKIPDKWKEYVIEAVEETYYDDTPKVEEE